MTVVGIIVIWCNYVWCTKLMLPMSSSTNVVTRKWFISDTQLLFHVWVTHSLTDATTYRLVEKSHQTVNRLDVTGCYC
ncbi:hypothetical protein SCLCIDRAFT_356562 [Scleroderma citrinum Foug A]|uniref:Uncharacterized protein n=1 Tax=Scleroderma citrinum Foug A TaxID=1036808 RepID=A0A0C2ZXN9_9AGAM|nr:hypothetical protein SCLCIDRAFT_356562 [Scleroderma citrinum Foug A]